VLPAQQSLVIGTFTDVAAFGTDGMLWRWRVCWDDLKITDNRDGKLFGKGFDPTNKKQSQAEFSIDLGTGRVLASPYL
jgi:hypothetical protein